MTSIQMKPSTRMAMIKWRWPLLVAFITGLGLVIRVGMAWAMRYPAFNGDFSIEGLMARHMAEGIDYPVFAYGVAYMGSLEPALSALLAKLLRVEVSAFIVNLSPALVGTALLPLVYLFGRDAGSRRAGILAMLFCLVGSDTLLHYSVASRGGYMNVMVGGLLMLWLACRIVSREKRGEPVSWRLYFGMGLAAGVAWWTTQLVVVFILSAAVVFLMGFKWRMIRSGMAPAVLGSLLGSLPWWVWNVTQQWGSLDFGNGMAKVSLLQGITSFGNLFLRLVEMEPLFSLQGAPRLAVLLVLIVGFVAMLIWDRIRTAQDDRFYFRLAAASLAIFMVVVYSTSGFSRVNATRYLLPLFPAVAIMVAVACDGLLNRFRIPWGWLAFILVIPPHILSLPRMFDGVPADRARWELAGRLQKEVAPLCDGNFVGDYYTTHGLNFASREALCVAALPLERYAPYARRVELAERRAYLNDPGKLSEFLQATRSESQRNMVGDIVVDYGLIPPSNKWRYVEPGDITLVQDHKGVDARAVLRDSVRDAPWVSSLKSGETGSLSFVFRRPARVCGIRLNHFSGKRVSIEGRRDERSPWKTLMSPRDVTFYFWSGPYVMVDGVQYFQEFRFESSEGGIREMRVVFHNPEGYDDTVKLGEALILESGEAARGVAGEGWDSAVAPSGMVTQSVAALQREGLTRFYAPRWLAERISMAISNTTATVLPSLFTRSMQGMAGSDSRDPVPVVFSGKTGLFMDARDVSRSREILREAALTWREIPLGPIMLFVVTADRCPSANSLQSRIYWTEQGCYRDNFSKGKAQLLYESACRESAGTNHQARLDTLRLAVKTYPPHYPARQALITALMNERLVSEACTNAAVLKVMTQPATPAAAAFRNGFDLVGVSVSEPVKRGRDVSIHYYWKCQPDVNPEKWAVFVHIKKKGGLFQDDHVLLTETPVETLRYQPFSEIFVERRTLTIHQAVEPGEYQLWIGLLDRKTEKRVAVTTELPHRRNAVELPLRLTVLP